MFINILAKVVKVTAFTGLACIAAKAVYSVVKAAKHTKEEVEKKETPKEIAYTDENGLYDHSEYEIERLSTKDKAKIFAKNAGRNFVTALPGKLGDVEESVYKCITVANLALWAATIGYVGCATDIELSKQNAAKKFGVDGGSDDALKWTAWVAGSYAEKCEPGMGYIFCKEKSGNLVVSTVEEE